MHFALHRGPEDVTCMFGVTSLTVWLSHFSSAFEKDVNYETERCSRWIDNECFSVQQQQHFCLAKMKGEELNSFSFIHLKVNLRSPSICDVINLRRKKDFFQFHFLFILFEVQFGERKNCSTDVRCCSKTGQQQLFLLCWVFVGRTIFTLFQWQGRRAQRCPRLITWCAPRTHWKQVGWKCKYWKLFKKLYFLWLQDLYKVFNWLY